MDAKFIMFSIFKLKYDRLETSNKEVEFEITEKANAIVRRTDSGKCNVRINVEVDAAPAPKTDDSKPMITLSTDTIYEFCEKPKKEDIDPYVVNSVNRTREALGNITKVIGITPLELGELTIEDFEQR